MTKWKIPSFWKYNCSPQTLELMASGICDYFEVCDTEPVYFDIEDFVDEEILDLD